jgi:hypothetical protein
LFMFENWSLALTIKRKKILMACERNKEQAYPNRIYSVPTQVRRMQNTNRSTGVLPGVRTCVAQTTEYDVTLRRVRVTIFGVKKQ